MKTAIFIIVGLILTIAFCYYVAPYLLTRMFTSKKENRIKKYKVYTLTRFFGWSIEPHVLPMTPDQLFKKEFGYFDWRAVDRVWKIQMSKSEFTKRLFLKDQPENRIVTINTWDELGRWCQFEYLDNDIAEVAQFLISQALWENVIKRLPKGIVIKNKDTQEIFLTT
jgi:hypothetical protein